MVLSASRPKRYGEIGLAGIRRYGLPHPGQRNRGHHACAAAGRALDEEAAVERLDAVAEPAQAGALRVVGAAHPVIRHLDDDSVAGNADPYGDRPRFRVLRDVRERFRDDVEDRHLDRARQRPVEVDLELDRDARALGQRLERGREAAIGEDRRMEAARQLAELLKGERELLARTAEDRRGSVRIDPELRLGEPEGERERDEALLGAVVEVPFEPPPLGVGRVDEPRARAP